MDNIKKEQDSDKMSGESKVVNDRDRARLRLKESVVELAAARGQEDDVIGKLIVKVNEVFNALVDSHVEMVLSLGEDLSDEIHENFMYEASDERDEAVEEAEEGKVKAKEIIKEKTIAKESIKVNNLGLMGKKDREEFFDEKLEISRKISQEVAESELFCMFSAWVDLRNARPDASLQRGEVPHEVSRALNRTNSTKQKLPSIPEEIFDGEPGLIVKSEFIKKGIGYGNLLKQPVFIARSSKDSQFIYDIGKLARYDAWDAKHPTQQNNEFIEKGLIQATVNESMEQQFGGLQHIRDLAKLKLSGAAFIKRCFGSIVHIAQVDKEGIRIMREGAVVSTPSSIEFYDPGEELFGNMPQSKGLTRLNITFNDRDPARFKLSDPVCVKKRYESIRFINKSDMAGQLGYDNGKLAEYIRGDKHPTQHKSDTFEKEQQFVGRHQARVFTNSLQQARDPARLNLSGLTYVRKSVEDIGLGITYDPREKLFINKPWSKSFARLKLTGTIYLEKRTGDITLIVKAEFSRKGIGDSSLFERSVFIARSSVDTVPVFKDNNLKVPEAICLKEENSQK